MIMYTLIILALLLVVVNLRVTEMSREMIFDIQVTFAQSCLLVVSDVSQK